MTRQRVIIGTVLLSFFATLMSCQNTSGFLRPEAARPAVPAPSVIPPQSNVVIKEPPASPSPDPSGVGTVGVNDPQKIPTQFLPTVAPPGSPSLQYTSFTFLKPGATLQFWGKNLTKEPITLIINDQLVPIIQRTDEFFTAVAPADLQANQQIRLIVRTSSGLSMLDGGYTVTLTDPVGPSGSTSVSNSDSDDPPTEATGAVTVTVNGTQPAKVPAP